MLRPTAFLVCVLAAATSIGEGQSVKGTLRGKPFRPDVFSVRLLGPASASTNGVVRDRATTYALTLQEGNDFIPDRSVEIWFNVDVGTKLNGYKLAWRPTEFGTEAHRAQAYRNDHKEAQVGRGVTSVFLNDGKVRDNFSDRISLRVAFGKEVGGKIPVAIELIVPNGSKITGTFTADVKRK